MSILTFLTRFVENVFLSKKATPTETTVPIHRRNRTHRIGIRMTEGEFEHFEALKKTTGMSGVELLMAWTNGTAPRNRRGVKLANCIRKTMGLIRSELQNVADKADVMELSVIANFLSVAADAIESRHAPFRRTTPPATASIYIGGGGRQKIVGLRVTEAEYETAQQRAGSAGVATAFRVWALSYNVTSTSDRLADCQKTLDEMGKQFKQDTRLPYAPMAAARKIERYVSSFFDKEELAWLRFSQEN